MQETKIVLKNGKEVDIIESIISLRNYLNRETKSYDEFRAEREANNNSYDYQDEYLLLSQEVFDNYNSAFVAQKEDEAAGARAIIEKEVDTICAIVSLKGGRRYSDTVKMIAVGKKK